MSGTEEKPENQKDVHSVAVGSGKIIRKPITQKRLKEAMDYNPDTGVFTWKINVRRTRIGDIAGCVNTLGYIAICIDRRHYSGHRLAWLYIHGYFPEHNVDHINRCGKDNRLVNLREATQSCNARNSSMSSNNTSEITGVYWHKSAGKWAASIAPDGRNRHLGLFTSKLDAAKARWKAEVEYDFPNCNTTSTALKYIKENDSE